MCERCPCDANGPLTHASKHEHAHVHRHRHQVPRRRNTLKSKQAAPQRRRGAGAWARASPGRWLEVILAIFAISTTSAEWLFRKCFQVCFRVHSRCGLEPRFGQHCCAAHLSQVFSNLSHGAAFRQTVAVAPLRGALDSRSASRRHSFLRSRPPGPTRSSASESVRKCATVIKPSGAL